jgi:hypothetical protein
LRNTVSASSEAPLLKINLSEILKTFGHQDVPGLAEDWPRRSNRATELNDSQVVTAQIVFGIDGQLA